MRFAALIFLLLAACDVPPVKPSADLRQQTSSSRIEGNVVLTTKARGNVVVFLFDASRPPPPAGTGRPLSFTVISEDTLFHGAAAGSSGPFTAPFAFSLVNEGTYLLRGFLDRDTCASGATPCKPSDFVPWYGVTGEPNAGDVGGAQVDALTLATQTVTIAKDEHGELNSIDNVTVSFADSATVPVDRPAFIVASSVPAGPITKLTLQSKPIDEGAIHEAKPAFLVRLVDDNADGVPDDANADGVPDIWPRVFLRKISPLVPSGLVDENDLDRDGVLDETGVHYTHADGTDDDTPDAVVLAAGIDPTPFLPLLFDNTGVPSFAPIPANELTVIVQPRAFDAANRSQLVPLKSIPAGDYSVTILQFTGQTWRLPNELEPSVAPGVGLPSVDGQDFFFTEP
ncbi:MAG: hypothetical protein ACJ790_19845 [Myxococcaceae bacterium]